MKGEDPLAVDEDLARWLQESGRRRQAAPQAQGAPCAARTAEPRRAWLWLEAARRPLLVALLAVALLQYFYLDVAARILSLPQLVFFILIG